MRYLCVLITKIRLDTVIRVQRKRFQSFRTQIGRHRRLITDWQLLEGLVQGNFFPPILNMLHSLWPIFVQCTANRKKKIEFF